MKTMRNGEWDNEPDAWDGEMVCLRRGPMGAWCGYAAVPPNHPLYGKSYSEKVIASSDIVEREIDINKVGAINLLCASFDDINDGIDLALCFDVHGGITYSSDRAPGEKPDGNWWFGFDCSHHGDYCPLSMFRSYEETYRDFEYAKAEALSLSRQLARWKCAANAA